MSTYTGRDGRVYETLSQEEAARRAQNYEYANQRANRNQSYGINAGDNGGLAWAQSQRNRNAQDDYAAMLLAQSRGEGVPSIAQAQLDNATNRAQMQQLAVARSGGGSAMANAANMQRAQAAAGQQQQTMAGQAAELRAREQQAALNAYGDLLLRQRQQDLGALQGFQNYAVSRRSQDMANEQAANNRTDRYVQGGLAAAGAIGGALIGGPGGAAAGGAAGSAAGQAVT